MVMRGHYHELIIKLTNGEENNLGKVVGENGTNGSNGSNGQNGENGKDGVGIANIVINDKGEMVVTLSNKTELNLGNVVGKDGSNGENGKEGKGIESIVLDENGDLLITFTDETSTTIDFPSFTPEHVHTFGEWVLFTKEETLPCEERLYYHACKECREVVWQIGAYEDHDFDVVTVEPTCTEEGYTQKTCKHCGLVEKTDYPSMGHSWTTTYSYDETHHWIDCEKCDEVKDYGEHVEKDSNTCTVCNKKLYSAGLKYELNEDGVSYSVVGIGTCTDTDIIIPAKHKGLPVTAIGDYAFDLCNLTSVVIGDSVATIGERAFWECYFLTSVKIPDLVTTISDSAFASCPNLMSVEFGASVTTIGDSAFFNCLNLTGVEIPNSLITMGDAVFSKCTNLTSIKIPDLVTAISDSAFANCTNLTSVEIGSSVTTIGNSAFANCTNLTSVEFGASVTTIGHDAFNSCDSLMSVVLPNRVTTIGSSAFYSCDSLANVEIPNSVTTIGGGAFSYCSSLKSIEIPNSVTTIGIGAFGCCRSLTNITVSSGNEKYQSMNGNLYTKDGTELIQYAIGKTGTFFKIPDSVITIGYRAFALCDALTSVVISDSVITISAEAFGVCSNLTSVVIGNSVKIIGQWAFSNCDSLTNVMIPNSVTTIELYAFRACTSLTSIEIPYSVHTIAKVAFDYCLGLTSITVSSGNMHYQSIDGNLYTKDGKTLIQYAIGKTEKSFTVPDSVTKIEDQAFSYCENLTSIVIGNAVTKVGDYAIYGCDNLAIIYYKGTVDDWDKRGLEYSNSDLRELTKYYYSETKPTVSNKYWYYDKNGRIVIW